jgi:hypothetical protein
MTYYDTPLASFFPQGSAYPGITPGAIGINQTPGVCDIGFIPKPQ